MYPQFFGLDKLPFRLRPDPDFLYAGDEYMRARAQLITALRSEARAVLLMGPPGVGKTLLLEDLLGEISGQFAICRINQPHLSAAELVQALLMQLGPSSRHPDPEPGTPQARAVGAASLDLIDGRHSSPLLVVDNAQMLAGATLRSFRDILFRAPRLRILLAGQHDPRQPGDDFASRMMALEKSRQIHLLPLSLEGTRAYIARRLDIAGAGGKNLFAADASTMIFRHTGGAARLINVLCDAALQVACSRTSGHVGTAEVLLATQDSRWSEAVGRDKSIPSIPESAPTPSAQFLVRHGGKHVATWPLGAGRLSIGRAPDNELRIEAPYISRHHCCVVTEGTVSVIEDLGSVNGLCINGEIVHRHVLQHADQVMLGEHVLTYVFG